MNSIVPFAGLLALVVAVAASATEITEVEVLGRVTDSHPALASLAAQKERATAERNRSAAFESPEIEATHESPPGLATQTDITLTWRPPLDGRRRLAVAGAEAGVAAAGWAATAGRLRVRADVRSAFATWWASAAGLAALQDHADRLKALAERARVRAAGGEESGLSARRLAAESEEATAKAAAARAAAARARAEVALWAPDLPVEAHPLPPPLPPEPPSLDAAGRPDLAALAEAVRQAEHAVDLAGRVVLFPELTAGWQRVEEAGARHSGLLAGIRWSVPLPRQARAARSRGEADLATARAALSLATSRAAAELAAETAAFAVLRSAAAAATGAESDAERLVTAAVTAFCLGEASVTDTLDTLRAALGSRLRAVDTRAAALASHRALELASGQELVLGGDQ